MARLGSQAATLAVLVILATACGAVEALSPVAAHSVGGRGSLSSPTTPEALDLSKYAGPAHTLMFVGAHPDDLATTVGGTVALAVAQGTRCVYVTTTNGDKGFHKNRTMTSQHLAYIRSLEQINSAVVLGVNASDVAQLDFEDGVLNNVPEIEVRQRIAAQIRRFQPDAIFTWSPYLDFGQYKRGLEHPDHRTTGQITLDAAYPSARDYLAFPSLLEAGLEPWITKEIYLFSFDAPALYVDISTVLATKTKSLLEHKSQYSNATAVADSLVELGHYVANQTPLGSEGYAEGFLPVVELS